MALFNLECNFNSQEDIDQIKSYLFMQNEQLKYMFANLTPEDNYSEKALEKYVSDGKQASLIEQSVESIKLNMLTSGNVVAAINLSQEGIKIKGDKISLEGVVTVNDYFKVGMDGSIEAKNGKFSGDISASNIFGSAIEVGGAGMEGSIIARDQNGDIATQIDHEGIVVFKGDISIGNFITDGEYTGIGDWVCHNYDTAYGRYAFMAVDQSIGFITNPMPESGNLWIWAGYDADTDTYQFQVNNSGQVWANDFCIRGRGSIAEELDDIWQAINNPNP